MSNTQNLNLYKANPVTDVNTAFNVDTLFNNNWDLIDANCIKKDGSTPFTAPQTGVAPTDATHLSTKSYVDSFYPYTATNSNMPTISNGTDTENDINISAGFCFDLTTKKKIELLIGITKQLDATFALGINAGGLDAGSKAINTWYHIWLISKSDGTTDSLFSTSATAPTMPTEFVNKRRIASVGTNSSGGILQIVQDNNFFTYKTRINDKVYGGLGVATQVALAVSVPPKLSGIFEGTLACSVGAVALLIQALSVTNIAPTIDNNTCYATGPGDATSYQKIVKTNASSQIGLRTSTTGGGPSVTTVGYIDERLS